MSSEMIPVHIDGESGPYVAFNRAPIGTQPTSPAAYHEVRMVPEDLMIRLEKAQEELRTASDAVAHYGDPPQ